MSIDIPVGEGSLTKELFALEEIGYRNVWESSDRGLSSFLK